MGAGEADGVFVSSHDIAPGLRALKHGDVFCHGSDNFGVFVVNSGSTDDAVRALNILRLVTDGNGNARFLQMVGGFALMHIGAGDLDAHAMEHHTQSTHGYTADADEMHMLAGL